MKSKIFISADMEGISGIVHQSQTGSDQREYEKGRTLMVRDVNAAIDGFLAVCKAEIVVSDAHGNKRNIEPEDLHESAVLVRGSPKPLTQIEGMNEEFDGCIFVGYHSKKGTGRGILSHTISGRIIDNITINGLEVGETAINAAISGYFGVPLIFVSGDLAVTKEAEALNSNIVTVSVKEAVSRTAANCIHPRITRGLIKEGVMKALKRRESIKPFTFKDPIAVQIKFFNSLMADAVVFMPFIERIGGRAVGFSMDDYLKAFRAMRASIFIASSVYE
jgi:D-amino peptidase